MHEKFIHNSPGVLISDLPVGYFLNHHVHGEVSAFDVDTEGFFCVKGTQRPPEVCDRFNLLSVHLVDDVPLL